MALAPVSIVTTVIPTTIDVVVYDTCIERLRRKPLPKPMRFVDIVTRAPRTEHQFLIALRADPLSAPAVKIGEHTRVVFTPAATRDPEYAKSALVEVDLSSADFNTVDAVVESVDIIRRLLEHERVVEARVERSGNDAHILPSLPLVRSYFHAVVATDARVAEDYDDVAAFWACWDAVEQIGEHRLATIAVDAVEPTDYLDRVQNRHRAMARLVKPTRAATEPIATVTKWVDPKRAQYGYVEEMRDEERVIYLRGEGCLRPVAYIESDARAEFSCVLEEGQHIPGWEIDGLWRWLYEQSMPDGSPLREARITFAYESQARAEKRPLLDVGARVFYLATDRSLVEIID